MAVVVIFPSTDAIFVLFLSLLICVDPIDERALTPDAFPTASIRRDEDPLAMLLALVPLANVLATIWPLKDAVAVLTVLEVVTAISSAIRPFEAAISLLLPLDKGASVVAPVLVLQITLPVHAIPLPVARVDASLV